MSGTRPGVLVETDLIVDYLLAPAAEPSLLRRLMEVVVCYTTFIQASEIYSAARGPQEERTVERALFGLKILGASSRYAKTIGGVLSSVDTPLDIRTAVMAAMAMESKLPIVTALHAGPLSGIEGIVLLSAERLKQAENASELAGMLAEKG